MILGKQPKHDFPWNRKLYMCCYTLWCSCILEYVPKFNMCLSWFYMSAAWSYEDPCWYTVLTAGVGVINCGSGLSHNDVSQNAAKRRQTPPELRHTSSTRLQDLKAGSRCTLYGLPIPIGKWYWANNPNMISHRMGNYICAAILFDFLVPSNMFQSSTCVLAGFTWVLIELMKIHVDILY